MVRSAPWLVVLSLAFAGAPLLARQSLPSPSADEGWDDRAEMSALTLIGAPAPARSGKASALLAARRPAESRVGLAAPAHRGRQPEAEKAKPEAKADGPDAKTILRAVDEKLGKAKTISFSARREGLGSLATRTPAVTGEVTLARIEEKSAIPFKVAGKGQILLPKTTQAQAFQVAYDGAKFRSLREKDKTLQEREADTKGEELFQDGPSWLTGWIFRWQDLVRDRLLDKETIPAEYDGVAVVEGTPCDVIHLSYNETGGVDEFDFWWFIGQGDSLPHRIEAKRFVDGADGIDAVTISNLRLDGPAPDDMTFALFAPEGYKTQIPEKRAAAAPQRRSAGPKVGADAPAWTLKDPDGKEHSLADYKGKVVVMDFWATWCGPCKMAMPGVQKIHEKFKDKPVVVFGLDCWEQGDAAKYMKSKGFTYGLLLNADEVAGKYGVSGIPTFFVIGADGKVIHQAVGFNPDAEDQLAAVIEKNLKEAAK